jgi:hypothetical protein
MIFFRSIQLRNNESCCVKIFIQVINEILLQSSLDIVESNGLKNFFHKIEVNVKVFFIEGTENVFIKRGPLYRGSTVNASYLPTQ